MRYAGLLALAWAGVAEAQLAVPATGEPHHHVSYADSLVPVLRVEVAPHEKTLLHEHTVDYFWIAVGASDIVNAIPGQPEVKLTPAERRRIPATSASRRLPPRPRTAPRQ